MRVQIKPALRQVWRGPGTVQIGLDPRFGTLVDGLTEDDRALLERLTDGVEGRDAASRAGGRRDRDRQLLGLLGDAGVLVTTRAGRATHSRIGASRGRLTPDAAVWSVVHGADAGDGWELVGARAARFVEVIGGGRTGAAIAATLAAAGVGRVLLRDPGTVTEADVAPAAARPEHVGRAWEATAPGVVEPLGTDQTSDRRLPDLVVLVEHGAADAGAAQRLLAQDVPHLSIVVQEGTLVVGPLVRPGLAPCLRCLDLHRTDRDPGWPRVLAQVLSARRIAAAAGAELGRAEETASSQLAASLAALQALTHLDGRALPGRRVPAAVSATLEVELPDGLVSRRPWPGHPACGCHGLPGAPLSWTRSAATSPSQDGRPGRAAARMAT